MTSHSAARWLRTLLLFIAAFHVMAGLGLMFSMRFQRFAVSLYGAELPWDVRDVYFIRIIGSFAFVLGSLAAMAVNNPAATSVVALGFIEFFVLRNIHRHLFSQELYAGFAVSPLVNDLTTVFFGVQAIALAVLLWMARRPEPHGPR